MPGAVFALGWQLDALFRHFLAQELVRHLDENARAVAGGRIRAAGTAVVHLLVHRERFHDDVVRALALQMGDETDAAGVFFARRMPKALGLRASQVGMFCETDMGMVTGWIRMWFEGRSQVAVARFPGKIQQAECHEPSENQKDAEVSGRNGRESACPAAPCQGRGQGRSRSCLVLHAGRGCLWCAPFPWPPSLPSPPSAPLRELAARVCELPYDVMSSDEAKVMAAGNPLSFLHVRKPEIDLPEGTDPVFGRRLCEGP